MVTVRPHHSGSRDFHEACDAPVGRLNKGIILGKRRREPGQKKNKDQKNENMTPPAGQLITCLHCPCTFPFPDLPAPILLSFFLIKFYHYACSNSHLHENLGDVLDLAQPGHTLKLLWDDNGVSRLYLLHVLAEGRHLPTRS